MFEFSDPAFVDFVQRHRIQVVQFFPTLPMHGNEVRLFELLQMLGNRLACHIHVLAEGGECLAVILMQYIQQASASRIGQCFKYFVDIQWLCRCRVCGNNMQVNTCMSSADAEESVTVCEI